MSTKDISKTKIQELLEKYEQKFNDELKNVIPINSSNDGKLIYKEGFHDGIVLTLGSFCEDLEELLK